MGDSNVESDAVTALGVDLFIEWFGEEHGRAWFAEGLSIEAAFRRHLAFFVDRYGSERATRYVMENRSPAEADALAVCEMQGELLRAGEAREQLEAAHKAEHLQLLGLVADYRSELVDARIACGLQRAKTFVRCTTNQLN